MMQAAIIRLIELGRIPSQKDENIATEEVLKEYVSALKLIERPISIEEAHELLKLFGVDLGYGIGWSFVHLIESAFEGWELEDYKQILSNYQDLPHAEHKWIELLRLRCDNAMKIKGEKGKI